MPSEMTEEIGLFVERYAEYIKEKGAVLPGGAEKIHVDEIASKVAVFYEKVRGVIEYRDVHLLRRSAIERILRRRIFLKDFKEDFAEPLVKELIRGGHLPNDAVPETKIADIRKIINNLLALLKIEESRDTGAKGGISDWFVRMFVSRIEEELFPSPEVAMLSEMMYGVIRKNLTVKNIPLTEDEANLQLFVAVQRALFRPDKSQLQYLLLKITHPNWGTFSEGELEATASNLAMLKNTIDEILKNHYASYFLKLCSKEKIIFQLIGDLVFDNVPLDEDLESSLKLRYDQRYLKTKKQLRRLAFLSVVSFLISKLLVAFAIEIPLDEAVYHSISILSLIVNIGFPPFLMLLIVSFVKLPSRRNFVLVEDAVKEVVFQNHDRTYVVAAPKKKGWLASGFVYLAYGAVLFAILYYVTKWLWALHFSPASIVIFLLFTSMVTATGVRVKNRAKEMSLEKEAMSMWGFLVDLVTVPFMTIGRWTIAGLSKFNVLVVAFDFLIELPFQFFVELIENFRGFLRERKDEIS
jgi:hypothetical protein